MGFGHAPLSNLYESLVFFAGTIVLICLVVERKYSNRVIGAFVMTAVFEMANLWLPEIHPIFSGGFIIMVMLFLPDGFMNLGKRKKGHQILKGLFFAR